MLANCAVIITVSLALAKDKNKKILSVFYSARNINTLNKMKLCASIATQVVQSALGHPSLIALDQLKSTAFRALKSIGIST